MDKAQFMDLEFRLIDALKGKMNLLQTPQEREELVDDELKAIFHNNEFTALKSALDGEEATQQEVAILKHDRNPTPGIPLDAVIGKTPGCLDLARHPVSGNVFGPSHGLYRHVDLHLTDGRLL